MAQSLLEQIRLCTSLPSLPAVTAEVLEAASQADANPVKVARLVAKDPALAVKVLRSLNSSYYGLSHKVTSIEHAVPLLGLRNLKFLITGLCLFPALKRSRPTGFDHPAFWRRSLYGGAAAKVLGRRNGSEAGDDSFLIALLMDIGMLALAEVLGSSYCAITAAVDRHVDLPDVELARLGMTHAQAGGLLAEHWKLPESIIQPIRFHHDLENAPAGESRSMTEIAVLAGACADVFIESDTLWSIAEVHRLASSCLKMATAEADKVLTEIDTEVRMLSVLYEVTLPNSIDFPALQRRAAEQLATITTPPQQAAGADRGLTSGGKRAAQRYGARGNITIFPCFANSIRKSIVAGFEDISSNGIGLCVPQALEVSSQFILGLSRSGGRVIIILYTVRHCEALLQGFKIGAELQQVLREADLLANPSVDSPLYRVGRVLLSKEETGTLAA